MKFPSLFRFVLVCSLFGLCAVSATATQPSISGYTSINYDINTNTVMAYSETDLDYRLIGNYQAYV